MSDLIPARHEEWDVNVSALLICAGVLAASVAISFGVAWWAFGYMTGLDAGSKLSAFPLAVRERGQLPLPPRLEEIDRLEELKRNVLPGQLRETQRRQLTTYGWVDEQAGIVHIPIDRAMKVLVQQHRLPSREAAKRQAAKEGP